MTAPVKIQLRTLMRDKGPWSDLRGCIIADANFQWVNMCVHFLNARHFPIHFIGVI